jgi:branched-chain amino acid aminotransferase
MTTGETSTKGSIQSASKPTPKYIWYGGDILPWDDAKVHVTDMSWTSISAVFEGIRGYWNKTTNEHYIFRLDAHLKRLNQSMKLMRMNCPYSDEEIIQGILTLSRVNEIRGDLYITPFAYFSGSIPGYEVAFQEPVEIYITAVPNDSNLEAHRGSHCCVSSWVRISDNSMPPRAKSISNYQNSRLVSTEAKLNGYDSGIILNNQGKVSEGAYACIFIIRDGVAITPPVTAGILESITRDSVIQILREDLNIEVRERNIDRTELYIADEVLLCGTYAEIEPVISIDKYTIGTGDPGPITNHLRGIYKNIVTGNAKTRTKWVTKV